MANNEKFIGDINMMVLRDEKEIPTIPMAAEIDDDFELVEAGVASGSDALVREPRQLEAAVALSAAEAAEFLAAAANEVVPVVHEALTAGAVAGSAPEAIPATGLIQGGEVAAAAVPAAAATLLIPPVAAGNAPLPAGGKPAGSDHGVVELADAPWRNEKLDPSEPSVSKRHDEVVFGDSSVHTRDVSCLPIYELPHIEGSVPDFVRQTSLMVATRQDNFVAAVGQLSLRSRLLPMTTADTTGEGINVDALVFDYHAAPLVPAATSMCEVKWGKCIRTGYVAPSDLAPYMIGNSLSARYTADMLKTELEPVPLQVLTDLAKWLQTSRIFHDNRAMYAKLFAQGMAIDIAESLACQTTPEAWPAAASVSFVNLDDAAVTSAQLAAPLDKGHIVFIEGLDWTISDLAVTHWLATPGFRVDGADGHNTAYAGYLKWPEIPVTVFRHGAAPARPVEAMLTSTQIYAFARKLALTRHEEKAMLHGLYIAMELVGVRYIAYNNHNYGVFSNHNAGSVQLPRPHDYNFMYRIAHLWPADDTTGLEEVETFCQSIREVRVLVLALYNAAITTFTTTMLFSISLTVSDVTTWGAGGAPNSPANQILAFGICQPPKEDITEAAPYSTPKRAIKQYMGYTAMEGLFNGATWNGRQGSLPNIANHFQGMNADRAIRWQSVLALDDFLLERPQEWAILGPRTKINLTEELIVNSTDHDDEGVRTYLGEAKYSEAAASGDPYLFIPYGNQVVNAIHQYFTLAAARVHYQPKAVRGGRPGDWSYPRALNAFPYNAQLHVLEPCCLASYAFGAQQVRAPAMILNDLTFDQRKRLLTWVGQEIEYVGFALNRCKLDVFRNLNPVPTSRMASLGLFSSRNPGGANGDGEASTTASLNS